MITICKLTKSYADNVVLNDISQPFEEGKVYGIVGSNAAGKTTLFRCIAGLNSYEGHIGADQMPLKAHLGFLSAEPYFLPMITGAEYLTLLMQTRAVPVKSLQQRNIFDLPLDQYISTYSTGMKKKLAITGVLLQNNKYFILDEPYNGIDLQSSIILTEIISKLKSRNKIILISSHIFSTLKEACDELLVLAEGKFTHHYMRADFDQLELKLKQQLLHKDLDALFEEMQ